MKTYTEKYLRTVHMGFADFIQNAVLDGSMQFQLESYTDGREGTGRVYVPGTFGDWTQDGNHVEEWNLPKDGLHVKMEVIKTNVYDKTFRDINGVDHWLDAQHLLRFTLTKLNLGASVKNIDAWFEN